jgi:RNA polymerase sigma-70 factor (ECF subfamily)
VNKQKPSFEELYYEYYGKINRYIRNKINNKTDADDLTQESFEYCYKAYDSFDPERSSISTWLFLIVNSRIKNYYRDRKVNDNIEDYDNLLPSADNDMDRAVYLEELKKAMLMAINKLPEKQRTAVIQKFFLNKSHKEIAQAL